MVSYRIVVKRFDPTAMWLATNTARLLGQPRTEDSAQISLMIRNSLITAQLHHLEDGIISFESDYQKVISKDQPVEITSLRQYL
jgi:hypothetical protein